MAMPTPRVVKLLNEMAGGHLNREAVNAFMGLVQLFPVGAAVRVSGGRFDQCVGVVVAQAPTKRDRPVVRLLFDRNAHAMREGVDLDLQAEPEAVELHNLPETGVSLMEQAHILARSRAA
jgi:hypothetical protein